MAASGSKPSAASWSRDCTLSRASGSCCTGLGGGWARPCGSTRPPSTSPTTSASTHSPLPLTKPSCCRPARRWRGDSWIQPGLPERRVGLFLKLHRARADGIAGVAAFGALLDLTADAPTPVAPPWTPGPIPTPGELLYDNLRRRAQEFGRAWSSLAHPSRTLRRARAAWPTWREFFAEQRAPQTSLNRPIGADRKLATVGSRLELAKQ